LAAGMAAQAIAFLEQANIVTALDKTVWNTSWILKDSSFLGRALHTLIGYVDQPTAMQVVVYAFTLAAIAILMKLFATPPAQRPPAAQSAQARAVSPAKWSGQIAAAETSPRSASSASRHSTSRRITPPPEKISDTIPAGESVSANSTASKLSCASFAVWLRLRHLQASTRSKRSPVRHRRKSCLAAAPAAAPDILPTLAISAALIQSKRLSATTKRCSLGRHNMSAILTSESCTWAEITSMSSLSRATSLSSSVQGLIPIAS